ncbi:class I SAM-dependent methyltransferase [Mesorhizobium sp. M1E.F.Ca.ET.045.02.1.1]|uniref:class I SAM-dependent methyltransferase n=1 Tax=Mesorhizobium sp. M1E.F.Ca.ET.045.02.1.1 TaxID=2493672 RepID=UPI000F74CA5A|nr:class I SAM-dependent methyltransferase [Mesorhizobium sp. M1E.F.Ca.ET.045.02.1.1]AZO25031.1 class I SAM-dependent methyltransferase [Mesorhizobium sp. M1E.F.Ca.ET.045.02.1.1]TKB17587.1 MAG: class I SAM-dependent methyltransferase [Mesorhizobium sp.]
MSLVNGPLALVASRLRLDGLRILDIGCGKGGFAKELATAGSHVIGIDPEASAISAAALATSGATFQVASAEALPFQDGSFDAVTMINSLHHVPAALMSAALREAARVLSIEGLLFIIEPLTTGNFFEALKPVEDETEVRLAAQAAVAEEVEFGHLRLLQSLTYNRTETFSDATQLFDRMIAVDPNRAGTVKRLGDTLVDHVVSVGRRTSDGRMAYDQPIKADVLAKPST